MKMNLYEMTQEQIEAELEQLKRDTGYRDLNARHRPKLMQMIDQLEQRLYKLKSKSKLSSHKPL
jgi:uncharacterized coiled-coil DUF342 family protein